MMDRALGDAPIRLREQDVGMLKEGCPWQIRKAFLSEEVRSYAERFCTGRRFYRCTKLISQIREPWLVPVERLARLAFRIGKVSVHSLSQQSCRSVSLGHRAHGLSRRPAPTVDFEIRGMGRRDGFGHVVTGANGDCGQPGRHRSLDELRERVVVHYPKNLFTAE